VKIPKILASKTVPFAEIFNLQQRYPKAKFEDGHCGIDALHILPLFNNNIFSHEILWVYTAIDILHTDTLKTIPGHINRYSGTS
jgi:hypothetical protein